MIIDECQEKMNCLYSLVNVSSVISDLSIFITGWGGGEGVLAGTLGFQGERRGIRYTYSTSNTPRPRPPPPARAINNGRSFMITRAFVTVCHST